MPGQFSIRAALLRHGKAGYCGGGAEQHGQHRQIHSPETHEDGDGQADARNKNQPPKGAPEKRGGAVFYGREGKASGVVIFEMSVMAELRIPGSRIRKTRARIPKIEAMIKGLLRIPHKMLKKLIFPF